MAFETSSSFGYIKDRNSFGNLSRFLPASDQKNPARIICRLVGEVHVVFKCKGSKLYVVHMYMLVQR